MLAITDQNTAIDEIGRDIIALDKAIEQHSQWQAECSKKLICGQQLPKQFLRSDTHKYCGFDRWYFGDLSHFISMQDEYLLLEKLHKETHACIGQAISKSDNSAFIQSEDYDKFIASETKFALAVVNLRDALFGQLYSFDYLTGVYNRQAFYSTLEKEFARIERSSGYSSIVMVDLDFFKQVNDNYGHKAGDNVLTFFANYLKMNLRPYDSVGRYGGEEFLLCLPDSAVKEAELIMERLRKNLAIHPIKIKDPEKQDIEINITASFGISSMSKGHPPSQAIEEADMAMYEAKSGNRNQVRIYSI